MPILDYSGSAGVFKHLGAIIARVNSYQATGDTTLPADLALLLAAFGTTWLPEEGVASYYEGLRDSVTAWRQGLASFADRRVTDLDTVLRPLGLGQGAGLTEALIGLRRAMRADAQTVKACACGVGVPAYDSANRGNGKAWLTTTLDGFNAPVNGGFSDWSYDGQATQLTVPSEVMVLECVADSVMDGLPIGGEAWRWSGGADFGPLDVRTEGSGEGPGLTTSDSGYNLLANGSLDTWSNPQNPASWSLSWAHYVDQFTTPVIGNGGSSAGFVGQDGSGTGVVSLVQTIPPGSVQGRRRYFIGFNAYRNVAIPGGGVTLSLGGTGFAPGEQAALDTSAMPINTWTQAGAFVTLPSPLPPDLKITLSVVNPTSSNYLWVDSVVMTPAVYHGGIAAAVQAGSIPWQRGDRISWSVSNDSSGLIQSFFRKWMRCQLPCVASGATQGTMLGLLFLLMPSSAAETINESLVA